MGKAGWSVSAAGRLVFFGSIFQMIKFEDYF